MLPPPVPLAQEETKKHQDTAALNDCKTKLSTWCQINYAECYSMLLHLKAVRVFVESVLRYGLAATYSQGARRRRRPRDLRSSRRATPRGIAPTPTHHIAGSPRAASLLTHGGAS